MSSNNHQAGSSKTLKPKFVTNLKELASCAKLVIEHEKEINNYGLFLQEKQSYEERVNAATTVAEKQQKELETLQETMKKQISALNSVKDKEIAQLHLTNTVLVKTFEKEVLSLKSEAETQQGLLARVENLKQELNQAESAANSAKKLAADQKVAARKREDLLRNTEEKLQATVVALRSKEREMSGTLSELERYRSELDGEMAVMGWITLDEKHRSKEFQSLADICRETAKHFFMTKLPEGCDPDKTLRALRRCGFLKEILRYIPLSNSLSSQYLRAAIAQSIISSELCEQVFISYYLPASPAGCDVINGILRRLSSTNPRREAVFRQMLLYAYEGDEAIERETELVRLTVHTILDRLAPLLENTQNRQEFQKDLQKLVQQAIELWKLVQRGVIQGRADNEPGESWLEVRDSDAEVESTADQKTLVSPQSYPMLSLFPRVLVGDTVLYPGCALWSDHNVFVTASNELSQNANANASLARVKEGRRLSMAESSTRSEVTVKSPVPSRNSFSGHVNSRNLENLVGSGQDVSRTNGR